MSLLVAQSIVLQVTGVLYSLVLMNKVNMRRAVTNDGDRRDDKFKNWRTTST